MKCSDLLALSQQLVLRFQESQNLCAAQQGREAQQEALRPTFRGHL